MRRSASWTIVHKWLVVDIRFVTRSMSVPFVLSVTDEGVSLCLLFINLLSK